ISNPPLAVDPVAPTRRATSDKSFAPRSLSFSLSLDDERRPSVYFFGKSFFRAPPSTLGAKVETEGTEDMEAHELSKVSLWTLGTGGMMDEGKDVLLASEVERPVADGVAEISLMEGIAYCADVMVQLGRTSKAMLCRPITTHPKVQIPSVNREKQERKREEKEIEREG
ncbi:hypothetical protein BDQ17DRAFT_1337193, partial [Cyathus striatus]